MDPDQTAPRSSLLRVHAVCFYNYLQQTTSADDIFRCIFFLGALRVKLRVHNGKYFSYFSTKTYVMGTQNSGLIVTVLSECMGKKIQVNPPMSNLLISNTARAYVEVIIHSQTFPLYCIVF